MADDGQGGLGPDAYHRQGLAEGEIRLQRCNGCGRQFFYARYSCPHCHSRDIGWGLASGAGVVHSTTVMRRRPDRGGDYNVAIVELAEGPRMMSRVEGVAPDQVAIGMAVTARVAEKDGTPYLVFDPTEGGSHG